MNRFVVVPHDPRWAAMFEDERKRLVSALGGVLISVHHIGSTSIPDIYAKPVIDMLAEVSNIEHIDAHSSAMVEKGYEVMGEFGIPGRRYFRKDIAGVRTFQMHAFQIGAPDVARHLAFRDYLIAHADEARDYSELKKQLVFQYNGDPDLYMGGKDGFINEIDRKAALSGFRNSD